MYKHNPESVFLKTSQHHFTEWHIYKCISWSQFEYSTKSSEEENHCTEKRKQTHTKKETNFSFTVTFRHSHILNIISSYPYSEVLFMHSHGAAAWLHFKAVEMWKISDQQVLRLLRVTHCDQIRGSVLTYLKRKLIRKAHASVCIGQIWLFPSVNRLLQFFFSI